MLEDFIYVCKGALENTRDQIRNIPALWLFLLVYALLYTAASFLISLVLDRFFYIGGLVRALVKAGLFSHLFYILDGIVNYNRVYWKHLKEGFSRYLSPTISLFFVYWLVSIAADLVGRAVLNPVISQLIDLVIFLIFAGAGEYIYIGGAYSYDSVGGSIRLLAEEPINWALCNGVLYLIFSALGIDLDIYSLAFSLSPKGLVAIAVVGLYLVFRGNLFKEVYMSSRRKREYMR